MCHQQQSCQALFDQMETRAGRRLCHLVNLHVHIKIEAVSQCGAQFERATERRYREAQCAAGSVNKVTQRRYGNTQYGRDTHHAFIPDQSDFQSGFGIDWTYQRDKPAGWEVNMALGGASFMQNSAGFEFDLITMSKNAAAVLIR